MADQEHLRQLKQGPVAWNDWRKLNPDVRVDLRRADLRHVNFRRANLRDSDLRWANLRSVVFAGTKLGGARLWGTHLEDADLTEARDLTEELLAGAYLSRAQLPQEVSSFRGVTHVEEAAKSLQQVFLSMLAACLYAWLTIAATTDAALLTNATSVQLPIIGGTVPIRWFHLVVPALLFLLYVYFQLSMRHLCEIIAQLPAVFPDGQQRDQKIYPRFLGGIVRTRCSCNLFKKDCPLQARLETLIFVFFTWGVVPLTILGFWGSTLPLRDWGDLGGMAFLLMALFSISIVVGLVFYCLATTTLRGEEPSWSKSKGIVILCIVTLLIAGCDWLYDFQRDRPVDTCAIQRPALRFLRLLFCGPFADFDRADVSSRPANWTGYTEPDNEETLKKVLALVKGADLEKRDLSHATAKDAFLAKANLKRAIIRKADFTQADLRQATLYGAKLQDAILRWATLRLADLRVADLTSARLEGADLNRAFLSIFTDCHKGVLKRVNLWKAKLAEAWLHGADLKGANLEKAYLKKAHLEKAQLQGAILRDADLTGADLQEADLSAETIPILCEDHLEPPEGDRCTDCLFKDGKTHLPGADLQGVNLREANLQGADLRGTKNLTLAQLSTVKTLYRAQLDPPLLKQIQKQYPALLLMPDSVAAEKNGRSVQTLTKAMTNSNDVAEEHKCADQAIPQSVETSAAEHKCPKVSDC